MVAERPSPPRVVDAYRELLGPGDEAVARVWTRLAVGEPRRSPPWVAFAGAVAAAVVVAWWVVLAGREATAPTTRATDVAAGHVGEPTTTADRGRFRSLAAEPAEPPDAPPAVAPVETTAADPPPAPPRTPAPRSSRPPFAVAPAPSALAAENALVDEIRRTLRAGEAARALARVDDYLRRFPAGVLREEADALRVLALCSAGMDRQGRAEARRFLRAHAASPFRERIEAACAGTTEPAAGGQPPLENRP